MKEFGQQIWNCSKFKFEFEFEQGGHDLRWIRVFECVYCYHQWQLTTTEIATGTAFATGTISVLAIEMTRELLVVELVVVVVFFVYGNLACNSCSMTARGYCTQTVHWAHWPHSPHVVSAPQTTTNQLALTHKISLCTNSVSALNNNTAQIRLYIAVAQNPATTTT